MCHVITKIYKVLEKTRNYKIYIKYKYKIYIKNMHIYQNTIYKNINRISIVKFNANYKSSETNL